jgi:hypothetical protein
LVGPIGPQGIQGPQGLTGPVGPQGPEGPIGPVEFADFYALVPLDDSVDITPGQPIPFPRDGANSDSMITRVDDHTFNLLEKGFYKVIYRMTVLQPSQLILRLNGIELPPTLSGISVGGSQMSETAIIVTTTTNAKLSVINPNSALTHINLAPFSGGLSPVSAHLIIEFLKVADT